MICPVTANLSYDLSRIAYFFTVSCGGARRPPYCLLASVRVGAKFMQDKPRPRFSPRGETRNDSQAVLCCEGCRRLLLSQEEAVIKNHTLLWGHDMSK